MYLQWHKRLATAHIQLVMNNLKFMISGYLTARNLGFWTDTEISATGP